MKVLVLAPHADDLELGCGGTIARWVREGNLVNEIIFSIASLDVTDGFDKNIRKQEAQKACEVLGINGKYFNNQNDFIFHRNFGQNRQDILDEIVTIKESMNPDIVTMPCASDIHQDHQVIYAEGVRGMKGIKTILGYDTPWNHMINGNYFVELTRDDVEKKIQAVECYISVKHKPYANPEFLWSWARFRGLQAGCEFAEVFEVIRCTI